TAPSTTKLNFDDLQSEARFRSLWVFGASKMANLLFTFGLARKLEGSGVTVNAIHPGLMRTTLMREAAAPIRWLLNLISQSPEKAAEPIVKVAIMPEYAGKNGLFFAKGKEIRASTYAYDKEVQARLWDVSLRLTGLK
ncbi:MAG TPA: SDR family NAD(P)-dependent oxidoreductase, partial [Patescibacteria group bacterium]|nr:SDR family NAD(P)-dependent oxidoreductase [Patescibacteria group bacterium]